MKLHLSLLLLPFLFSCSNKEKDNESNISFDRVVFVDSVAGASCAYLSGDDKENIYLSWVREINDSVSFVCYAVSKNKGGDFSSPIQIPVSKNVHPSGENMPKIAVKPNGDIIAMWGENNSNPKNKYSGLVYYSQSFDEGKTWSEAIPLVSDTSSYDQRYFDLHVLPGGEVMSIWLDSRGKAEKQGSTLYCAVTNGRNGFQSEKAIGFTCCQCCRTDLFIDKSKNIHVSYRDIINDSIRDMVHIVSTDQGKTFSEPVRISADNWVINGCPHTGPTVTENNSGLHFAWYTMGSGNGVFYCNSKDSGKTFSQRDSVCGKQSAKHPQIASTPNGSLLIVWDENVKSNDKTNSWIGMQKRTAEGKARSTIYITPPENVSEFPALKAIDDESVLIAFRQRGDSGSRLVCKLIKL